MTDDRASATLVRGTVWLAAGEAGGALATGIVGLVAARLLGPGDFGVVGAALLVASLVEAATQPGFDRALTQRQGEIAPLIDVAWTWHVLRGLFLTLAFAAAAPLVARWFEEPALRGMTLALCPVLLLRGCQNLAVVTLARRLDYRRQFVLRVGHAAASALLTLPLLFVLRNAWALVGRGLIAALLAVALSFLLVPHRPRFVWNRARLRELMGYGRWITASTFMVFLITQGDDVFVGSYLGLEELGTYQMAYWLSNLPATHVVHLTSRVTFPVFASLQAHPDRLRQTFETVLRTVLLISCSLSALLLVAAPEIVEHLLGPAWLGAVPAVRLLAVAGLLRSLAATGAPLFQAIGRPDLEFKQNFPRFVCLVVLLWPAASAFGLAGVCFAVLASLLPAVVVWSWAIHEALDLGPRRQLALVIGPLLAGCLLAPALAGARELMPAGPAGAASALIVGVAAWLAALAVLAPARRRKLLAQLWRTAELLREPR